MTDPSPVFRWRYTPSLFPALPLAPLRFLHVNVLLLLYPVAVLFVLCLAICGLCSVSLSPRKSYSAFPSAPVVCCMLSLFNSNLCFAFFASQTPALCSVIHTVPRKSVVRLCLIFLYSVIFVFACFASQTSGLCSFPSAPVKSVTRFCYALVRTLFCVFCLTNTGFAQCYSLGSRTVCCTLVFNFALFNNFCFTCFASQTSGLCSAIPSALAKFVARLCLILLYSVIFCFCCNALPSAPVVCCTLLLLVIYVSCFLPHQLLACAVLFPSAPLKFTPYPQPTRHNVSTLINMGEISSPEPVDLFKIPDVDELF